MNHLHRTKFEFLKCGLFPVFLFFFITLELIYHHVNVSIICFVVVSPALQSTQIEFSLRHLLHRGRHDHINISMLTTTPRGRI